MDNHFTYNENINENTLRQGDILEKTDELKKLINEIHPHYANEEYTHFQVLTQSCDLVRRGRSNKCASRYITLAAVRNLDIVIQRTIQSEVESTKQIDIDGKKWCSNKGKARISNVMSSLFNNNDKNLFYLHTFPSHGLNNNSCTFLHLSIAIRAHEHYDVCLNAKRIELTSNFQAKLGWLVGNLYSRVGTADFVPTCYENQKEFDNYIETIMDDHVAWVPSEHFVLFKKIYTADNSLSGENLLKTAELNYQAEREKKLDTLTRLISSTIKTNEEQQKQLRNLLDSRSAGKYLNI